MENIILAGHGSPKKDANNLKVMSNMLHCTIHPGCAGDCVKVAYLQFEEPDIMTTIKECVGNGAKKIIIHPFFLSSGMHVTKDIPDIIREAGELYPAVEFVYTAPLGIHEKLVGVVLDRIRSANGRPPSDIERRSFEVIGEEFDLSGLPPEQLPIVKRVIHSTADFEFRDNLMFHPDAIRAGIDAIRSGRDILTDIEMVRTGINKRLLEKWGGKVICNIRQSAVSGQPSDKRNETKAEQGIEAALTEDNNIGIVAIGNAPTALLKAIELLNSSTLRHSDTPILIIGVPVGFVNAVESKALLSTQDFPFVTSLGRKGGTPVAVAIVNALLKMAEEAS